MHKNEVKNHEWILVAIGLVALLTLLININKNNYVSEAKAKAKAKAKNLVKDCSWEPHDEEIIRNLNIDCDVNGKCTVCSTADNVIVCSSFNRWSCD